jgi:protein-tyrosine-phosphatase
MRAAILVVCGSDACLAPAAAVALRARLAGTTLGRVVDVASAGVRGEGVAWCEESASLAPKPFAEPARWVHRSRKVNADMVRRAGLVLVTERRYRGAIRLLDRHSAPRTFTLAESAALAAAVARERPVVRPQASVPTEDECAQQLHWLVEEMDAHRGLVGLQTQPAGWRPGLVRRAQPVLDILDPHDERSASHRRSLSRVDAAVHGLANALTRSPVRSLVT